MKRAKFLNLKYLLLHAEDIINNTEVLSPQWLFSCLEFDEEYKYRGKNETWEEAEDRIVRDYCKATGHWDLFIWEEVEE